ncbi:Stimulator of interferon genes protein [Anabarilius grahami]|uniref:Stimulator of interferon genes protein n=1 Tax=Anabarilius grahami TaxID=495550 RepID=A0A3N0YVQ4_ANAGA|nr:Stimulator of interferon genes protein [Anabarilius grahami]
MGIYLTPVNPESLQAEDRLCRLRQSGRPLERYVEEFLEVSYLVGWPDASLNAVFLMGLDKDIIRYSEPACNFSLVNSINLILFLNGSNFEVDEIKKNQDYPCPAPSAAYQASPAHLTPEPCTYRFNGPVHSWPSAFPRGRKWVSNSADLGAKVADQMMTSVREDGLVPRARSRLPVVCAAGLGLLMLVFAWMLDSDIFRERAGMFLFCLTVQRFIHSMCLFAEEWLVHSRQRYHGRINEIFQACFKGHVILGMCAIILMLMFGGISFSHEQWSTMAITCAGYLLLNSLGVLGPAPVEISEICEVKKMNVAHGLAWSFYIGYLKFVLPDLENKISQYSSTRTKLSSPRLHILLPLNAVVPTKPEEDNTNVVFHENLPELELDIAGVRNRSYKNCVYKITQNNKVG